MKPRKWHLYLGLVQIISTGLFVALIYFYGYELSEKNSFAFRRNHHLHHCANRCVGCSYDRKAWRQRIIPDILYNYQQYNCRGLYSPVLSTDMYYHLWNLF